MSKNIMNKFHLLPVAAAILLANGNTYAGESAEVHDMVTPESYVSIGIGRANTAEDSKRFSEYTGLNQKASPLLDIEVNKRDEATGLWTTLIARNLGLETAEMRLSQEKQGSWKYALEYNEIVRLDPYIIHTGMTGIGTTTPTINLIAKPAMPAAWATANGLITPATSAQGNDEELKLKRTAVGLSGERWFTPELQFALSFRTEEKKGARMFGRAGLDSADMQLRPNAGTGNANGGWAVLLTPEPIDSNIHQLEAKLNFARNALALSGGYYGSFYVNNFGSLSPNVPDTLNRGLLWNGCATPGCSTVQQLASANVALPPDNQAHQFYLSGKYDFSQNTRSNFKVSYTHATQNEDFVAMGLTPSASAPANLGGVVDTTLAQIGLTMQPLKELSVNASLRYEDRADKTPIHVYNTNGITGNALNGTTNWPSGSQTRTNAKLDGIYRLASGYSVMLGGDWEHKVTPLPPSNTALFANQVLFRSALNEYGIHAEVRKALSEVLNGALGYEYKQRRGTGDWMTTNGISTIDPATSNTLVVFDPAGASGNRVLPIIYMDRNRSKVRGNLDWEATEKLSLQALAEHAQDDYLRDFSQVLAAPTQIIPTVPGARTIISDSISLDMTYMVSDDWRANGYWTQSYNRWNVNKASLGDDTRNNTDTFGLKVNGKITSKLSVGMDVLATRDTTTFTNLVATSNVGGPGNIAGWTGQTLPGNYLPDINYRTNKVNVHGKYALDKMSEVGMVVAYQQFKTDDWQWSYNGIPFLYSDNTTVSQPMSQHLKFIGLSYRINL